MTDSEVLSACSTSTNQVHLTAPYHDVTASLCVRRTKRAGLDAWVMLNGDGQILCLPYGGCPVRLRYDAGSLVTLDGNHPEDGSSDMVFLPGAQGVLAHLRKASATKVELTFFQNGSQVLEFNTKGLLWPPPANAN